MNIGNNVADRCYTPYRTNQNTGYFKGFMQTEKGLVMKEQSDSTEEGFIEKFVDYKEFHKEWMSQPDTDYYFGHAYDVSGGKKTAVEAMELKAVRAKIEELYEKIKNGDTEQKFSIGAEEYTIEEWDELLAKFDEAEEEIRKAQEEEIEKRMEKLQQEAERKKAEEETEFSMTETELLTAQTTQCSYPPENSEGETVRYIICYTEKGIFCSEAGKTEGYVWSYSFKNKEEYEKVMDFLDKLPLDWNLRFTAHENFWKDFLNGKIDETEFLDFLDGTNKGVPDYTLAKDNSVYVDTDKIKWAPYFNPLGSRFYTAEEFQKRQRELIEANAAKLPKLKK